MKAKMLKLEKFAHIIQYAVYTHSYRLTIYYANFFLRKHKQKGKFVLQHWYGLFILCASNHKTQNLTVLGDYNYYLVYGNKQDVMNIVDTVAKNYQYLCVIV